MNIELKCTETGEVIGNLELDPQKIFDMFGYAYNGMQLVNQGSSVAVDVPQDISLSESTIGEVVVSWTDVVQAVDGYKVYRRLTSVGGSWGTALGTIGTSVGTHTDTTISPNTEYDYKVVAYIGSSETTNETIGENLSSITTYDAIQGLLFADGDRIAYPSNKVYSGAFNIQVGIQGLSDGSGSIGLVGNSSGTNDRVLLSFSLNKVRANIAGGSLLQSPLLSPTMDLSPRKIVEIYRDGLNDVYYVDGDEPAQFCFNKSGDFTVNSLYLTGGFGTAGYMWYYNDGDQEWLFDEGSGDTLTSTDDAVDLTITPLAGGLPYIDGTMWTAVIPPPTGFVEFVSLSVSARSTANLHTNLDTNYTSYAAGTVERRIAEITSNSNPEGFTHAIIATGTNDVANPTKFLTDTEYGTELGGAIDALQGAGITVIVAFTSSIVTSILQADKDFDDTIGAMLSGDPMNPTPESQWDFNVPDGGKTAVLPLYVTAGKSVCTTKSCTYIDTFQNAIDNQTSPYDQWISSDGIHYTTLGYNEDGQFIADQLDLLGLTGSEKFVFLGDSLGNSRATNVSNYYNA